MKTTTKQYIYLAVKVPYFFFLCLQVRSPIAYLRNYYKNKNKNKTRRFGWSIEHLNNSIQIWFYAIDKYSRQRY